jgi:spore coat protein CotF
LPVYHYYWHCPCKEREARSQFASAEIKIQTNKKQTSFSSPNHFKQSETTVARYVPSCF